MARKRRKVPDPFGPGISPRDVDGWVRVDSGIFSSWQVGRIVSKKSGMVAVGRVTVAPGDTPSSIIRRAYESGRLYMLIMEKPSDFFLEVSRDA